MYERNHSLLNLLFKQIPIGIIAGGSGNGLARSIAEYSGESEEYLRNPILSTTLAAIRGNVKKVNLVRVMKLSNNSITQ